MLSRPPQTHLGLIREMSLYFTTFLGNLVRSLVAQLILVIISYYNEFVAKVFLQVWLLYFETSSAEEPVQFVEFVQNKLQQKIALQQSDTLQYVAELIHKICVDFLLYDKTLKSVQLGKTVVVKALKDFPCNSYMLRTGLLSNRFNIQTNVTSSIWTSLYTSLVRRKGPCKSFVISHIYI